jgi:serine/threonine protein kinase
MSELENGSTVGNYEVVGLIGTGGMASVYRVRHRMLGSEHVLKVLDPALTHEPSLRDRFLAEGRIQAQLNHPAIVAVTDIVVEPGVAGLVAELVEGQDLDQWIEERGGTTDHEVIRRVFLPILDGLGHAHRQKIIHRDIKPSNILVGRTASGRLVPKLSDFGIAKVLSETSTGGRRRPTRTGARLGTIHYMSPEQIRGASDLDARTDIFALAVTLYEFISGDVPFDGGTDYDTMKQIVEGEPVPLQRRVPGIDPGIAACVARGLRGERAERFPDCAAFADELANPRRRKAPAPPAAALRAASAPPSAVGSGCPRCRSTNTVQVSPYRSRCDGCGLRFPNHKCNSSFPSRSQAEWKPRIARQPQAGRQERRPPPPGMVGATPSQERQGKRPAGDDSHDQDAPPPPPPPRSPPGPPSRDQVKQLARGTSGDFVDCPICRTQLRPWNLVRHFDRVHVAPGSAAPEAKATSGLKTAHHPPGSRERCPHCGSNNVHLTKRADRQCYCHACKRWFEGGGPGGASEPGQTRQQPASSQANPDTGAAPAKESEGESGCVETGCGCLFAIILAFGALSLLAQC